MLREDGRMDLQRATALLRRHGINTRALDDNVVRRAMQEMPETEARELAAAYRYFKSPDWRATWPISRVSKESVSANYQPSYKAWINVDNGRIISFGTDISYHDALITNQKEIGVPNTKSTITTRILAERKGWVAVGINTKNNQINAIISAMTAEQAVKAARLLYKEYFGKTKKIWATLTVKTNYRKFRITGRDEVVNYLQTGKSGEVYI